MGLFDLLGRIRNQITTLSHSPPPQDFHSWAAAIEATQEARLAAFGALGTVSPMLRLRSVLPSPLAASPPWPATSLPSLCAIERNGRTIFVTHGLSDPYDPAAPSEQPAVRPEAGHGCELLIEVVGALQPARDRGFELVEAHWAEAILWEGADWEAGARAAGDMAAQFGVFTFQASAVPEELSRYRMAGGGVALLIGQIAPGVPPMIELPLFKTAQLLPVQVITPAEYDFTVAHGNVGGVRLAERLAVAGVHHVVLPERPSVV